MTLKNKKILFIGPRFYFYHTLIVNKLRDKNCQVVFFEERYYGIIYLILKFLGPKTFNFFSKRRYKRFLDRETTRFDLLFVIRGESFDVNVIQRLKERNPNCKSILYAWDSVKNFNYLSFIKYFDKVYSFDYLDANNYNLDYCPSFYADEIVSMRNHTVKYDYDLMMIATYLPERMAFIRKIKKFAEENGLRFYYYLYITKFSLFKLKLLHKENFDGIDWHVKPMSRNEVFNIFRNSRVIVDINNKHQSGLSMRVIEAIGAGKKFLTTNVNIKKCIHISDSRYRILEPESVLDKDFIFSDLSEEMDYREDLFVDNWLAKILNV